MSTIDLHNLGTYTSVSEVWVAYPEGGHEGDYVYIGTTKTYWNKYTRTWGDGDIDNNESTSGVSSDSIYIGTTLKVAITPIAIGFSPTEDDWQVKVTYGDNDTVYTTFVKPDKTPTTGQTKMIEGEDEYYIVIDTAGLSGDVRGIVTAWIPDDDLEDTEFDGIRTEVTEVHICRIINL